LLVLLLLVLPAVVQAQFRYTTSNGTITITGYTGPGGAVTIPDTINGLPVTSIGDNAFAWCSSLTSVTIGAKVTSIGNYAFAYCGSLTSIAIPNSVTSIGYYGIGYYAFSYCTSLSSITIGNSVTSIGHGAFEGCTSLTAIRVDTNNSAYSSLAGVLFNKSQTMLIQYPPSQTGTSYTIPDSVTSIGGQAFDSCTSLRSVTIPDSVTSIEYGAFEGCTSLTSVTIGTKVTNIGQFAFSGCTNLTSVTIPDSVTRIGDYAFYGCTSLTSVTIGKSVTSIGDYAFRDCTSLTSVTIGKSVTSIGYYAFLWCTSLTAITVDALNSSYSSVAGVLFNKSQMTLIQYPLGQTGTSYTIPNSVTSIEGGAFGGCTSLTSVTIGAMVTSIPQFAFESCTNLTSVTIPDSVTSIEYGAFQGCTSLTSVTIGNGVTRIGDYAFYGCASLTGAYFQGNAPSLGGSSVFAGNNHATVYYLPGTTGWGTTFGGRPTVLWPLPTIQTSPQTQTAEAGSAVGLRVEASSSSPLFCLWYLNDTNLLSCSTNQELELTNVQFAQSGTYTVVVTNGAGAITSSPAMLNLIAAVERRPAEGVQVMGEAGSLLNVDYANSLSATPNWLPLDTVSLVSTSQYCFDASQPLPPQRYYRAWQTGTPSVIPSLSLLGIAPAITLTGTIGHSVRLDYIDQYGPTDAWVTLATVTLTSTSQLYFDVSAPGQPPRLYRIVPLP
jgi:hypothetical protein